MTQLELPKINSFSSISHYVFCSSRGHKVNVGHHARVDGSMIFSRFEVIFYVITVENAESSVKFAIFFKTFIE